MAFAALAVRDTAAKNQRSPPHLFNSYSEHLSECVFALTGNKYSWTGLGLSFLSVLKAYLIFNGI